MKAGRTTPGTVPTRSDRSADAPQRVCGILVTFNPQPELLDAAMRSAAGQLDHLIVLDNGSRPGAVAEIRRMSAELRQTGAARITERYFPSNLGLPTRFNEGIRLAREAGDRFGLLLDQDSVLQPEAVAQLLEAFVRVSERVSLAALEAWNEEPMVLPTDDFLAGYWRRHSSGFGPGLTEDFLGTNSGLFFPLDIVDRVGGFDESFFLDAVDFEFTLRLRHAGGQVLKVGGARIWHQRGEPAGRASSSRAPWVRRVQPVRHYYVARDVLRTWGRYWRRFPLTGLLLLSMPIREAVLVVLFYRDRRTHLYYLSLGTLHALTGVAGRIPGETASPDPTGA